jgi:hypothetical protein
MRILPFSIPSFLIEDSFDFQFRNSFLSRFKTIRVSKLVTLAIRDPQSQSICRLKEKEVITNKDLQGGHFSL